MKKQIKSVIIMAVAALMVVSCGPKSDLPGFSKTKSGLHYKFENKVSDAQQVKEGDVLIGELILRFDKDTIGSNVGNPGRCAIASEEMMQGLLSEGLVMMHIGERATFAIDADTLAKYFPGQMPPTYAPGTNQKMFWDINLTDILTKEEYQQEKENFERNMEEAMNSEAEIISKYVEENNITAKPNENGLYVIINKKGNGAKVAAGKSVSMAYTGRLLDGTIFDSSLPVEGQPGHDPISYVVGQQPLIPGWEHGIAGQPAGTQLTIIMPSALGYGSRGAGRDIPPYSPLRFDIEILSVQ